MSLTAKLRKVVSGVAMMVVVGLGLSVITVLQRPPQDGIKLFSLTYVIFSNGIAVWIALSLLEKERLGQLCFTIGDVLVGNVGDVTPFNFSAKTKGTVGAMLILGGVLTVFVSGVLDSEQLAVLGSTYETATRALTFVFWLPLQTFWADLPVEMVDLLSANNQNAGSLAAAAAVMLGELIDAVGVNEPQDLV